jgi:small conductance mechanosensitive channel
MLLAMIFQDAKGDTPDQKGAEPPPIDVAKAATELVNDPTATVSKWVDIGWDLVKTHGPAVLGALFLLFLTYLVAGWVRGIVIRAMNAAKIDVTLGKFFGNMAKWTIIIFGFLTAAGTVGISTTGFAALVAASGLAIGLALQGNLGNLAAGVLLLIFRPFKIGDAVIVAGQAGVVDGIDLFTTNLDTADNRRIIVPNGAIFSGVIENQTHHTKRRVDYTIQVAPGHDIEHVRGILRGVLKGIVDARVGAIDDPLNAVGLADINPNQTWSMSLWVQTPQAPAVRERLIVEVRRAIDQAGLAPAVPVQLVKQVP